jgi:glyceraldehyde 3-phosphate dehydrogenase
MTKKRIAINGFGRIGRLTTRILLEKYPEVEIVAINDLTNTQNLAYLFEFDSVFGRFGGKVECEESQIIINHNKIKVFAQTDPSELPWKELGIDIVLECTGHFLTRELAQKHLDSGAKRVILSAPAKSNEIPTVVFGANLNQTNVADYKDVTLISNASCTTNCVAPVLKTLDDQFAIQSVFALTNHAYTATQPLQDSPTKKDFRDGRAGGINLIPSTSGAAKAVELVVPTLSGKINLSSLRVPVPTGSMVFITIQLEDHQTTSVDEVNLLLKTACETDLLGIMEYSEADLVSSDIVGNSHTCIIDSKLTDVLENTIKLVVWYDNEFGYSSRLADLVAKI